MFHVRQITASELVRFSRFAACEDRGFAPATAHEFQQWLQGLWASGRSGPECCWVAEREGRYTAAVVYWRDGKRYHIEHVRRCEDGSTDDYELLAQSTQGLCVTDGTGVWAEVVSPPMAELMAVAFGAALSHIGFHRVRHRLRFRRSAPVEAALEPSIVFRSFVESGETAFVQTWAAVSALSLDQEISKAQDLGVLQAHVAKAFDEARGDKNDTRHFDLAYLPDGTVAGLVAAGIIRDEAVIHFYGVIPGLRGRGLGRDLLMHGVRSLAIAGAESVRLDADAANAPSVRIIRVCGFKQVRSYSWYETTK